jgi:hypothetical protein
LQHKHWPEIKTAIETAMISMQAHGYCWASWQSEVLSLSSAFHSAEGICVVNVSVSTPEQIASWIETLAPRLLRLKEDITLELLRCSSQMFKTRSYQRINAPSVTASFR